MKGEPTSQSGSPPSSFSAKAGSVTWINRSLMACNVPASTPSWRAEVWWAPDITASAEEISTCRRWASVRRPWSTMALPSLRAASAALPRQPLASDPHSPDGGATTTVTVAPRFCKCFPARGAAILSDWISTMCTPSRGLQVLLAWDVGLLSGAVQFPTQFACRRDFVFASGVLRSDLCRMLEHGIALSPVSTQIGARTGRRFWSSSSAILARAWFETPVATSKTDGRL